MRDHFPLRPRPQEGESIYGFIIRIAKCNGLLSINDIFKLLGLRYQATYLDAKNSKFRQLISMLAPSLKASFEAIFKPLTAGLALQQDENRAVIDITSQTPKVCPCCLNSDVPYIKYDWQMMHISHCDVHAVPLIDSCPNCNRPHTWNADLLEGCSACGYRWADPQKKVSTSPIPMHQSVHHQLNNEARDLYLKALYAAALCVYNPCIYIRHQSKRLDLTTIKAAEVFTQAYSLLQDTFYAAQFKRATASHLINNYSFLDITSLKTLQNPNFFAVTLPMNLPADKAFIPTFTDEINDDTAILSDSQAAALLGIHAREIKELNQSALIEVGKVGRTTVYQFIQLNRFVGKLVERVTFDKDEDEYDTLKLTSISSLSHKFMFHYGESLKLILDNNLPLYSHKHNPSYSDIFVNKSAFINLLRIHEHAQFERFLSPSELAAYFNVDTLKIKMMAEWFSWEKVETKRNSYRYASDSIKAFKNKYVVLEKWCDFQVYDKLPLFRHLVNMNIEPVGRTNDNKNKLFIFEKSDSLFEAIEQFEANWHKEQTPRDLKLRLQIQNPALLSTSAHNQFRLRCGL